MKKFLLFWLSIFISCGASLAFDAQEVNVIPIKIDNPEQTDFQIRPKTDFVENVVIPFAEPEESPSEILKTEEIKQDSIDINNSITDSEEDTPVEEVLTEEDKEAYTEEDFQPAEDDITLEVPAKEEKPKQLKENFKQPPETIDLTEQRPFTTIPYSNNTGSIYRF